ncbi:hypothetical protein D3C80_1940390 [compost metagenome]
MLAAMGQRFTQPQQIFFGTPQRCQANGLGLEDVPCFARLFQATARQRLDSL